MKKEKFNEDLLDFIENSTCSFTCIEKIKEKLEAAGYKELLEEEKWSLDGNKYYIVRNNASIIAFDIPEKIIPAFSIITTHSDTPSLYLKPNGNYIKDNYLKYNIMPFGGLLNFGWLDHPLSLAGRLIINKNGKLQTKIVDFKKPLFVIPSVAIHQKADSNTNLDLNMQTDLQPIFSISKDKNNWDDFLKNEIKEEIISYDLFLYNVEKPALIGINNELLISPRIDNLTSVYSALTSFIESNTSNLKVFCSFNNEEIGSLTIDGADSNFLIDILKRIASHLNIDISVALANSFVISADNTHAIHPNHSEYADDTSYAKIDEGVALVKEESSTTNALSMGIIKTICDKNQIKYQIYTAKNDINSGSALSGISLRHVSVLSIDVGIAELAMHSSTEVCSINDIYELYLLMNSFYNSQITNKKGNIIIK